MIGLLKFFLQWGIFESTCYHPLLLDETAQLGRQTVSFRLNTRSVPDLAGRIHQCE